jgi:methionyl-tRNA formyltransferase
MTKKGYEVLKGFLDTFSSDNVSFVVGDRDRTLNNDFYNEIRELCIENAIPFINRKKDLKKKCNYKFAVSWRYLIDDEKNLIVLHDSLLPKYRGFAPLLNALINGEKEIGVTAIFAGKDYDSGNIINSKSLEIKYPIKINEAINRIIPLYKQLVNEIAEELINGGSLISNSQKETEATYSLWRDYNDFRIDWKNDSNSIIRFIDALGKPYSGATTFCGDQLIRIFHAENFQEKIIENRFPGKIIFIKNGLPIVVCGKGLLKLKDLRDENGKSLLPFNRLKVKFQ